MMMAEPRDAGMVIDRPPHAVAHAQSALRRIAAETGRKPFEIMKEFASLAVGPGGVTFSDYVRLRLFDRAFWGDADRRAVVGARRGIAICLEVNYRQDWYGLLADKGRLGQLSRRA